MNPKESPEVRVETLLALRNKSDALRLITEILRVKEMGPADHIRTKHEVKAFLETGDAPIAEKLLIAAQKRIAEYQRLTAKLSLTRGYNNVSVRPGAL